MSPHDEYTIRAMFDPAMATLRPTPTPIPHHHSEKIANLANDPLSDWLGFSALTFCTAGIFIMIVTRIVHAYVVPNFHNTYPHDFSDRERRSFAFHHVNILIKFMVFVIGVYPAICVIFGQAEFDTPISPNSLVKMGDMLMISVQLFCAMFMAELQYRAETMSWLTVAHHVATILTANIAYAISTYYWKYPDASTEIYLCLVWGFFDLIASAPIDPLMISRRMFKQRYPRRIRNCLYLTAGWTVLMTVGEIVVTAVLLYYGWERLGMALRVATPLCFSIWAVSQLHLAKILFLLAKKQNTYMMGSSDVELVGSRKASASTKDSPV